jgi:septum formation protein
MMCLMEALSGRDVILASASPRRQRLLRDLGVPFRVEVREIHEVCPDVVENPEETARCLARMKAHQFTDSELENGALLITADTVVSLAGRIIGKPEERQEAIKMLSQLSGNMHTVFTGVCIRSHEKEVLFTDATDVWFGKIPDGDIIRYVDAFQPFDKAGSYGIQEWIGYAFVEKINGSFFNVMGLPTHRLYEELLRF